MITSICFQQYLSSIEKYVSTSITDTHGIITYVSPAFCKMTGYTQKDLLGKKHTILRHPDTSNEIYKDLWTTIRQGKPWHGRIKNHTKNKESYWIDAHIEPIFNNDYIVGYQAIQQNITNEALFETLAKIDALTGLFNRYTIEELTQLFINESQLYKKPFSVIIVDVDDFKQINDNYGHQVGDEVLKKLSEIFQILIRSSDRIGRWGGEEFLILLPQTSYIKAKEMAERLRIGLSSYKFDTIGYKTASFGIAEIETKDTIDSLIGRADKALYISKEMGKNLVN